MSDVESVLRSAISKVGLSGATVNIHAALRTYQPVRVSPGEIIGAFLAEECTLLMPTFSYYFELPAPPGERPKNNGMDYITHASAELPRVTQSRQQFTQSNNDLSFLDMGSLPRALLQYPHRCRGNHPLNSFTALGPRAREMVDGQTPESVYSPFDKMLDQDGKVLMMGTNLTSLTLIHYAEMLSGRQLFVRWAYSREGEIIGTRTGSCSNGFQRLYPDCKHCFTTLNVLGSNWQVADARKLTSTLVDIIRETPEITHCHNENCLRCNDAMNGGPNTPLGVGN